MEKIDQIVNFLQGKSANLTVGEINQVCQILNSIKQPAKAPNETGKKGEQTK